jgi:hypothetical protein
MESTGGFEQVMSPWRLCISDNPATNLWNDDRELVLGAATEALTGSDEDGDRQMPYSSQSRIPSPGAQLSSSSSSGNAMYRDQNKLDLQQCLSVSADRETGLRSA